MNSLTRKIAVAAAALGFITGSAYAVPTLTFDDGITKVTVVDQSLDDDSGLLGRVDWDGAIGSWTVVAGVGTTYPVIGSQTVPMLDLTFNATGIGNLWITFSVDGFTASGGLFDQIAGTSSIGGGAFSVLDTVYKMDEQQQQTLITSVGPFFSSPFLGASSGVVSLLPGDILQIQVGITHRTFGITTGDKLVTVPDTGMTVIFIGLGLIGFGLAARRMKFAKA